MLACVRTAAVFGIEACQVTSLSRETGDEHDLDAFAATLAERFGAVYGRRVEWADDLESVVTVNA